MLNHNNKSINQVLRFVSVGVLNTAVDFAVLNSLIILFGIGINGIFYPLFKSISFLASVINSYILNKNWVFIGGSRKSKLQEGFLFFVVSGVGLLLNISISTSVFVFASRFSEMNVSMLANIGALVGSLLVLIWNFTSYKLIVFKK